VLDVQRLLVVGQKNDGTAISGEVYKDFFTNNAFYGLFGQDSQVTSMLLAVKDTIYVSPVYPAVYAIGISDAVGTAATGSISFTNDAESDGVIVFVAGSKKRNTYRLEVTKGDTAIDIATALEAAITASEFSLVTPLVTVSTVALTAVNSGTQGNHISLQYTSTVEGVAIALTEMSGGATNPSALVSIQNALIGTRYQTIVISKDLFDFEGIVSYIEGLFDVTYPILKDGMLLYGLTGTYMDMLSEVQTRNNKCINCVWERKVTDQLDHIGAVHLEMPAVYAAMIAAFRALKLTDGSDIRSFLSAPATSSDNYGGMHSATFPYAGTKMPLLEQAKVSLLASDQEILDAETYGASVFGNDAGSLDVVMGRMVTPHKTDSRGKENLSFKYLNNYDQQVTCREYIRYQIKEAFKQSRLTSGDIVTSPGKQFEMINKIKFKDLLMGVYDYLSSDVPLMVKGLAAKKVFSDSIVITVELETGTIRFYIKNPIVGQFRNCYGDIQLAFLK